MIEFEEDFDPVTYEGAGHGFMRAGEAPEPAAPQRKVIKPPTIRRLRIIRKR
jgi:carboxymethylenebutenolidase